MTTVETAPIPVLAHLDNHPQTNTKGSVRALFSLLDFTDRAWTVYDLQDIAGIHRHHSSHTLQTLTHMGLVRYAPVYSDKAKRDVAAWRVMPYMTQLCVNYNRLYATTIQQTLPRRPSVQPFDANRVASLSLQAFAITHAIPQASNAKEITKWAAENMSLHPQQVIWRALGGFATIHQVEESVHQRIQSQIKEYPLAAAKRPVQPVTIPRQARGSGKRATLTAGAATNNGAVV